MWRVKTVTKFKNSFFPVLIYWNDIEIHLGFQHSYLVPPPIFILYIVTATSEDLFMIPFFLNMFRHPIPISCYGHLIQSGILLFPYGNLAAGGSAGVRQFCHSNHLVSYLIMHLVLWALLYFVFWLLGGLCTSAHGAVEHQATHLEIFVEDYLADFYWVVWWILPVPPSELNAIVFAKQSNREKYRFSNDICAWCFIQNRCV